MTKTMPQTKIVKLLSAAVLALLAGPGCSPQKARVAFASPMGVSGSPIVTVSVMFDREIVSDLDVGEEIARGPFTITPAVSGTFRWDHQDEVVFTSTEALPDGQTYKVQIDSTQRALDGSKLDSYDWTFKFDRAMGEIEQADLAPPADATIPMDLDADDLHDDLEYDADVGEECGC